MTKHRKTWLRTVALPILALSYVPILAMMAAMALRWVILYVWYSLW